MNNVLVAIGLSLELFDRFEQASRRYREIIKRARYEGRDITDEELGQLRQESKEALGRWLDGLN